MNAPRFAALLVAFLIAIFWANPTGWILQTQLILLTNGDKTDPFGLDSNDPYQSIAEQLWENKAREESISAANIATNLLTSRRIFRSDRNGNADYYLLSVLHSLSLRRDSSSPVLFKEALKLTEREVREIQQKNGIDALNSFTLAAIFDQSGQKRDALQQLRSAALSPLGGFRSPAAKPWIAGKSSFQLDASFPPTRAAIVVPRLAREILQRLSPDSGDGRAIRE